MLRTIQSFAQQLQNVTATDKTNIEAYTEYLKSKYGKVSIQSVGNMKGLIYG